jgi:Xaa-Pro aminopeptidase
MPPAHAARRRALLERLGPGAVAVIGGKRAVARNSDVEHRFRQHGDVLYLSGFVEPEAVLVLAPGRDKPFVMFVRPRDAEKETWTGRRAGVEGAVERYGADEALPIEQLDAELPNLLDGAEEVVYATGDPDQDLDQRIVAALRHLKAHERRGRRAPMRIRDLSSVLGELRLIKDDAALDTLRRAAAITGEAHRAAMRAARGGMREYEIEALVDYTFRKHGGLPGYGTIVGGGANATILHYVDNDAVLAAGQLLLIDAGCELEGFTADVTRTFPIAAGFSPAQRRVYEIVLAVQKRCVAAVRPGVTVDDIHQLAVEGLTAGMIELGLLRGEPAALIESGDYKKFYMHRTSHWLGLDVHDVGRYAPDGTPRPLGPGMVLTVEPGLYVAGDAAEVPDELRGIGVRIEDDLLVTAAGHEVLTAGIPKEIAEIEALTEGRA